MGDPVVLFSNRTALAFIRPKAQRYIQHGFGVESPARNHYLTGYAYRSTFAELAVPLLFR